ncbi:hypothetical protein TNCV_4223621 [Trichonephila clavipes]|nr:hypothetical protein TNCV_4223621 [Trichonephila clavipes]
MNFTSSSHLAWGRFLNRFHSIPTSLWPPPAKSSAPCAYSEPWVHFRENFSKQKRQVNAILLCYIFFTASKYCNKYRITYYITLHSFIHRNALSSFATVMLMRKRESLGRKTVKSKAVEHTRAAEAPDEKRARLQIDKVRHSLARAAETPEQYQVRLQSQHVRQNASRASETPEQRQSRLHDDQVRN